MTLFRGEKIEDITKQMTVEGVPTAKVAVEFARRCGLDLPIFNAVNLIISGELRIEVRQLCSFPHVALALISYMRRW